MPEYRFVTEWEIAAPPEAVFEVILDSLRWPEWWRGVPHVEELDPGDEQGLGNVRRYTFRSLLPYSLVFDVRSEVIEPPTALRGHASGELEGEGRWSFVPTASGTHVRYEWDVRTTQWWMNLLAPVARPLFAWNHDIIMRWGEQGLRKRLGLTSGGETRIDR